MCPTCPNNPSNPVNQTNELVLPQRVVIQVDPNAAREVEVAMQYEKVEGTVVGGMGGAIVGLLVGFLVSSFFRK